MKNPCYNESTHTDCPDRHSGCGATCEKWADYVKLRDAEYQQRQTNAMLSRARISNWRARKHQEGRKKR